MKIAGISAGVIIFIVGLIWFLKSRKSGQPPIIGLAVDDYIQANDGTGPIWRITRIENGAYYLTAADGSATTGWDASYVESQYHKVSYP